MLGLYTNKDVQRLVSRLRSEYGEQLERQNSVLAELKEKNRFLQARVSELESERDSVSDAIVHAVAEGERIKRESALAAQNERKELLLLTEKCRLLSDKMALEYPESGDSEAFASFLSKLHEALGEEAESGFNLDDVLSPKQPLDLEQLCMDLGLMEEEQE